MTLPYHIRRPGRAALSHELALTLDAMVTHRWTLVLLAAHSKRPTGRRWQLTEDPLRVTRHVRQGGNIGLLCGPRSGVAVLDPDRVGWVEMIETLGQPGDAWVQTGSGRLHYYFSWQQSLPAKLVWAGETIGEVQRGPRLQQVVIPPSLHPQTGRPYRWLRSPGEQSPEPLPVDWQRYFSFNDRFDCVVRAPGYRNAAVFERRLARALAQPGARFRHHSGVVKFRCPACAAEGHDRHRDNAAYFVNTGRWGCAVGGRAHWRPLGELLGALTRRSA